MAGRPLPGEFDLIARHFAPLAVAAPGALGLTDDAALVMPAIGHQQVIATDTLISGVHFLADDPADLVARKLLRVNLSDIAAMGAVPRFYLLAFSLSATLDDAWVAAFAAGLAHDQDEFAVTLIGGDTTATPGPTTLTLTAIGEIAEGAELRRSTAWPDDLIYVSGTIGDAALGLAALKGDLADLPELHRAALIDRYRLPRPRVALGPALCGIATAAIDISDGLVADLGHICEASGVGARIEQARVPLSAAAAAVTDPAAATAILTGGDDYELAFTASEDSGGAVAAASRAAGVPVTAIGRITAGAGVGVVDGAGRDVTPIGAGYRHF